MPKSKRDKKVSLTKTGKKGKEFKQKLIENIRQNLDDFNSLYVFTVHNMRNAPLKDVREDWKGSRFFFAKKKIMALALGQNGANETYKNVHKIAKQLSGQCGLLFTNKPKDYVLEWFQNFSKMDFAKSGFVATRTVTLPAGPLPDFSHALEPHLRSLGLPTHLEKGVIVLREEHTVCMEGARLKPEQASVLKLLGDQMAEFKISLLCMWSKDGSFEKFKVPKYTNCKVIQGTEEVKSNKKSKKRKETKVCLEEHKTTDITDQENGMTAGQPIITDEEIIEPMNNLTTSELISDQFTTSEDVEIPKENVKTPKRIKTVKKQSQQSSLETPMMEDDPEEDLNNPALDILSPKFDKDHPRRSMRTPKPIKRTPEQRLSVKKLTVTAKKVHTPRSTQKRLKE